MPCHNGIDEYRNFFALIVWHLDDIIQRLWKYYNAAVSAEYVAYYLLSVPHRIMDIWPTSAARRLQDSRVQMNPGHPPDHDP